MTKRGRPRHPDILTPREWEVLDLLREGLSNDEIGGRLGITERTAKYHVSEILGKLGVGSRAEAAAWRPEERRAWWLSAGAPFAFLWRKASVSWLSVAVSGALVTVTLGGLALLAVLLLRSDDSAAVPVVLGTASQERIAFAAGGTIFTIAPDGSDPTSVVPGDRATEWNAAPALSPDGSTLLFTRDFNPWASTADGHDVRRLAEVASLVTPPGASNPSLGAQSLVWSPDGEHVAYVLGRIGGSGVQDVWVMRADGAGRREIYHGAASWVEPVWLDAERLAFYETPGRVRVFRLDGEEETSIALPGEERPALVALPAPGGRWLVGPITDEGPILYGPPDKMLQVADGVAPAIAPDGHRFAYWQDDSLWVGSLDGGDAEAIARPAGALGGRDRFFGEQPDCFPVNGPACSYRLPHLSWAGGAKAYEDQALGIGLEYPATWIEGAPASPVRPCAGCTVFGPPDAVEPHGVRLYAHELPDGCDSAGCLVGNGRRQAGDVRDVEVAGHSGLRVDIIANPPLGLVDEAGTGNYREVWTAIRRPGADAILLVAFYREGDAAAGAETLTAYEAMLASLQVD